MKPRNRDGSIVLQYGTTIHIIRWAWVFFTDLPWPDNNNDHQPLTTGSWGSRRLLVLTLLVLASLPQFFRLANFKPRGGRL